MKTWTCLLAGFTVTALSAAETTPVEIDLLPGEAANIVDLQGEAAVSVALLGSRDLDTKSVVPESLQLAGASIVKDAQGRTEVMEDVNGDGALDLVVQFAARELRLGEGDSAVLLQGKMLDGTTLQGRDTIRTLASLLRTGPSSMEEEKLPTLQAAVMNLPESRSIAVLGSADLDPRAIVLGSIRVDGEPIVKGPAGDVIVFRDADGDGRDDAVLWIAKTAPEGAKHRFEAMTAKGRLVRSAGAEEPAVPPAPGSVATPAKSRYPFIIHINDVAPANPYPATIQVSGAQGVVTRVRVTLTSLLHTCLNDLDIMLVAPSGQSVVLMSDVGGCGIQSAGSLTFDDAAASTLSPGATPASQTTWRPFNNTPGDPFPAPAPAPSAATSLSAFEGSNPNGDWKLYVVDDAGGDTGSINGWSLDLVTTTQVCSSTPMTIPDSGPASVYPATITLSGLSPQIDKVSVWLRGIHHNNFEDLDVELVDPGGRPVMLMSDAGGPHPQGSLWQLGFDDDAYEYIPEEQALYIGSYRPADYGMEEDVFPPPATPNTPFGSLFHFRGRDPNGVWKLYAVDDSAGGTGAIADGWCLSVTSIVPSENCMPFPMTIPEGAPGNTAGPAFPYPVTMPVGATSGVVARAQVRILGLSHTYPDDLDIALQAPSGRAMVLMSDVGGSTDINNLDVTIDTAGTVSIPDEGALGSGPYRPTDGDFVDPMPAGGPTSFVSSIVGESPNGDWSLWVNDDAGADVGSVGTGWCMTLSLFETTGEYCSDPTVPLTIPAGAPGTTVGPSAPYPWQLYVPQEGRIIRRIRVRIENLSHTYPDDLDVYLVGPQGQQVMLMSDAGGSIDMVNQWITFDDEAEFEMFDDGILASNSYRPHNFEGLESLPGVPPGIEYPELYGFQGTDAHGFWRLYIVDDTGVDVGSASRWCIDVLPLYPAGEASNVRWYDKTVIWFDAAPNATDYAVVRGTQADLSSLLTATPEGCLETFDLGTPGQAVIVSAVPPPGSFFWYLVLGRSLGAAGPAGEARIAGVETARVVQDTGLCP